MDPGVVGQIYDAAAGEGSWPILLNAIADQCGSENAALIIMERRYDLSVVIAPRVDPALLSDYNQYWWKHDPTVRPMAGMPVAQVTTLAQMGRETFLQSRFFNEYWRFTGLGVERIAVNLGPGDGLFCCCGLLTSPQRDEIDPVMAGRFASFAPHLARGVNIARTLHRLECEKALAVRSGADSQDAAIVVDRRGRILLADARAEDLLRSGDAIGVAAGSICVANPEANTQLRTALIDCLRTAPSEPKIEVRRERSGSQLVIEVIPWRGHATSIFPVAEGPPVAVLLLRDPGSEREARLASLRERFGLTQAEAALTVELAKGDGRAAAAERCGISINTARTHLMRVFEKTGVNRQAELIRLLID